MSLYSVLLHKHSKLSRLCACSSCPLSLSLSNSLRSFPLAILSSTTALTAGRPRPITRLFLNTPRSMHDVNYIIASCNAPVWKHVHNVSPLIYSVFSAFNGMPELGGNFQGEGWVRAIREDCLENSDRLKCITEINWMKNCSFTCTIWSSFLIVIKEYLTPDTQSLISYISINLLNVIFEFASKQTNKKSSEFQTKLSDTAKNVFMLAWGGYSDVSIK